MTNTKRWRIVEDFAGLWLEYTAHGKWQRDPRHGPHMPCTHRPSSCSSSAMDCWDCRATACRAKRRRVRADMYVAELVWRRELSPACADALMDHPVGTACSRDGSTEAP